MNSDNPSPPPPADWAVGCAEPRDQPALPAALYGLDPDRPRPPGEGRNAAYDTLVERVQACRLCPRMEGRRRVLGAGNGALQARVLFLAEAPGRLGGDRTGRPLTSDQTGRNFARLLDGIGWRREDVFVSNAVLCNPRDDAGRNAPPSAREIRHCSAHLRDLLTMLDPPSWRRWDGSHSRRWPCWSPMTSTCAATWPRPRRGTGARWSRSTTPARAPNSIAPLPNSRKTSRGCQLSVVSDE